MGKHFNPFNPLKVYVELIDSDIDDDPCEETVEEYGIPRSDLSRDETL